MSGSIIHVEPNTRLAAVVDVETTGLYFAVDEIVEAGVILFSFDHSSAEIVGTVDCYSGLREPRVGIHPAAKEVHGLSLDMLKGHRLDEEKLCDLFRRAEFVIAHNASFDRAFVTRLFPQTGSKPWLCSMRGIDWLASGCPGRSLELLRSHFGLEDFERHRAAADAAVTLALLSKRDSNGRPFLGHLLERLPGKILELQRQREQPPSTRKTRLDARYRRHLTETITESVILGPLEFTVERIVCLRRDPTPATRELMDLLAGIVADGVVDTEEFRILDQWLMQNGDLTKEFPFNILARQLGDILTHGRVEVEELEELHEVVLQILHPQSLGCIDLSKVKETPITQPPPRICFSGKMFVFTGNFYFGGKSKCEQATTDRGGVCKGSVTRTTDYVVVGGKGSPDWIHGSYGSKIEKAIDNVRSGCRTAIVSEAHWVDAVERISSGDLK